MSAGEFYKMVVSVDDDTLQHATTHCTTLHTLHHTATYCNILQHTATYCNTDVSGRVLQNGA